MNIALPSARADLAFSDADRQWVITAYTLAFGGLLLLGGRISDRLGRTHTFLIGLAGFAAASGRRADWPDLGEVVADRGQGLGELPQRSHPGHDLGQGQLLAALHGQRGGHGFLGGRG